MVQHNAPQDDKFKRKHKHGFRLNDLEQEALDAYCKKYKVENKAKFIRETIITAILRKFDEDYPTLFSEEEMRPQ